MQYKEMGKGPYSLRRALKRLYIAYFGSFKNISDKSDQNVALNKVITFSKFLKLLSFQKRALISQESII